jgi:hypothetical protein
MAAQAVAKIGSNLQTNQTSKTEFHKVKHVKICQTHYKHEKGTLKWFLDTFIQGRNLLRY